MKVTFINVLNTFLFLKPYFLTIQNYINIFHNKHLIKNTKSLKIFPEVFKN
jgi:hypothetical protein